MKMLMFKTQKGVELFFNEENHKFSSNNKESIVEALYKDFNRFEEDMQAAQLAMNLIGAIKYFGWEE